MAKTIAKNVSQSWVALPWHDVARTLVDSHRLIMLVGEPGTGKTTWAAMISKEMTGEEPEVIQGTPDTEMNALFGCFTLVQGETRFCDGPLPLALKHRRFVIVEEFNLIPLECRASLLALRGRESITNPFNGERLAIDPSFRLIATSNRENVKCARNSAVARALFDDFLTLETPCLASAQVLQWLTSNYPQAPQDMAERVTNLWEQYREINAGSDGKSIIRLSYRAADHLMKLLLAGMREDIAVEVALVNKYIIDEDAHSTARLQSSIKARAQEE